MKETKKKAKMSMHNPNKSIIQGKEKSEYFLKLSSLDLSELITFS